MKSYKTIADKGEASYEIQKSKFYAYTAPVTTEEMAREFVTSIKKKHFDARHNCSAWVLGPDSSQQKSNDDGEPGGTAGNPILEAIKQQGLTNVVVVITRYFGGIKLGAGGLIRAYNHTAALGLTASPQILISPFVPTAVTISYDMLGTIENWVRKKELRTRETEYTDQVTVNLLVPPEELETITEEITNLTAARCQINTQEVTTLPVPL